MENVYKQQLEKIESELERWLPGFHNSGMASVQVTSARTSWAEQVFPEDVKKMSDESMRVLLTPAKDMLSRGGKRWRPLLMTIICESMGGGDAALPLVPMIEFAHNATLIHDDIEDDSDERRGKPAIHKIYGVDTAINSGSFLYFLALSCIESYTGKNKDLIYKVWGKYVRGMHLGQAIDISWHRKVPFIPDIEEYFDMCKLKTGSLARCAAELGAYIAGAPEETTRKLGEAAEKLGVGFQILDDVKNLTTGIPGKKRGDDIVEGKKSLPILLYLTRFPEKREQVFYCFHAAKINGTAVPEVAELIQTLEEAGVLKEAENNGLALIDDARKILSSSDFTGSPMNDKGLVLLKGLIDLISYSNF
jgi:octaprenyl-diphosphate synthase